MYLRDSGGSSPQGAVLFCSVLPAFLPSMILIFYQKQGGRGRGAPAPSPRSAIAGTLLSDHGNVQSLKIPRCAFKYGLHHT